MIRNMSISNHLLLITSPSKLFFCVEAGYNILDKLVCRELLLIFTIFISMR